MQKPVMLPNCELPFVMACIKNHKLPRECLVPVLPVSTLARSVLDLPSGLSISGVKITTSGANGLLQPAESALSIESAYALQSLQIHTAQSRMIVKVGPFCRKGLRSVGPFCRKGLCFVGPFCRKGLSP